MRALRVALLGIVASTATAAAAPPPVVFVAQAIQPGASPVDVGIVAEDGTRTLILDDAPTGTWGLAAHPGTGRFALTFLQLPEGEPLKLGGAAVSKPLDTAVLVLGDRAHGVTAHVPGDPACTNAKTACFQSRLRFDGRGDVVFVESQASSGVAINRWLFAAPAKPARIAGTALASLRVSPDDKQVAVVQPGAIVVSAWPTQPTDPKRPAIGVKRGTRVALPRLLMSEVWPIAGALYYFRRDPATQQHGWLEAYDPKTKRATTLAEVPGDFPMWRHQFLYSASARAIVYALDTAFERATIYAAALPDRTPRAIATDAHALLDVSADGRYVLAAAYVSADKGNVADNPEQLWIIDVATGAIVARDTGVRGARVLDARFIGP